MPKLKAVLDTLEGVDAPLHGLYTKGQDDRFYLDVEGVDAHPTVIPALRKKDELLGEVKKLKEKLASFDGIEDPEATKAALKKLADLEAGGAGNVEERVQKVQKEYEDRIAAIQQKAKAEVEAAAQKASKAEGAARDYFRSSESTRAISAAKGTPELLQHVIEGMTRVDLTEDGKMRLVVLGKDGEPRIKDSAGTPFSIDDAVAELREDPKFGRAFDSSGSSGSGASGGAGGGRRTVSKDDPAAIGANLEAIAKGEVTVI